MEDLGQRLLRDLCKCFKDDPSIDEYDFLPVIEPAVNKTPFVVEEHKLGIEAWAVKILFQYAYDRLMKSTPNKFALWSEYSNLSRAVLMINADNQTAWNIRKLAIKKRLWCPQEDLRTNELILRKHPKSPESFAHRKWVLNYMRGSPACTELELLSVAHELEVCTMTAEKYANNYNAWSHRLWFMEHIAAWNTQIIELELVSTLQFVMRHVSDHSGFHYRQQLLKRCPQRVMEELQHNKHCINTYPGHEALWYHRRALMHQLLQNCYLSLDMSTSSQSPHRKRSRLEESDSDLTNNTQEITDCAIKRNLLKAEGEFCEEVSKAGSVENAKWQKKLSGDYLHWLDIIRTASNC